MTSSTDVPSGWDPAASDAAASGAPPRGGAAAPAAWAPPLLGGSDSAAPAAPRMEASGGEPWIAPLLDLGGPLSADQPAHAGPPEEPEEAYARGYAEGLERGAVQSREQVSGAVESLRGAAQALTSERAHFLRDLEANLSALAVLVAGKIVRRELAADPEIVRELVAHALQLVKPDSPVMVRLHPEDLAGVQESLEAITDAESGTLKFAGDEQLERGSFFVEGPHRIVDGRLDTVLTSLYERLAYD